MLTQRIKSRKFSRLEVGGFIFVLTFSIEQIVLFTSPQARFCKDMATQVNEFTVTCRIENNHLRFHRPDYYLDSVEYLMDTMEQTKWTLRLDPCHSKEKASLCFRRSREDDGPDALSLDYEFSFLQSDRSWTNLERPFRTTFKRDYCSVQVLLPLLVNS
ncbi:hypothetical protein CDAR_611191 [Caerostris darwini]|uniref:Uncharacterized protein n=1 Tax=Caerostris darwini TaxID=1538125 RepID=A0AAV4TEW1_9ARAC|nr:hypothetical protein CDAR_611191 [Caerostris darwini]